MTALPTFATLSCLATATLFADAPAPSLEAQQPPLVSPVRIAKDTQNNQFVVTDSRTRKVLIFDSTLAQVGSFPIKGKPLGIAVSRGLILVGNDTTGTVQAYDQSGNLVGSAPQTYEQPNDIAVDDGKRMMAVADTSAGLIKIHLESPKKKDAWIARQLPLNGPDPSVLATPTAVAIDPIAQEIFVSDFGDLDLGIRPRVQIFGYDGQLKATINSKLGMLGNLFSRPQGLAVDGNRILLVDSWISAVLVFDRTTRTQSGTIGTYGTAIGELSLPLDVVIDPTTADVLVTNNKNRRVERFQGGNQ